VAGADTDAAQCVVHFDDGSKMIVKIAAPPVSAGQPRQGHESAAGRDSVRRRSRWRRDDLVHDARTDGERDGAGRERAMEYAD